MNCVDKHIPSGRRKVGRGAVRVQRRLSFSSPRQRETQGIEFGAHFGELLQGLVTLVTGARKFVIRCRGHAHCVGHDTPSHKGRHEHALDASRFVIDGHTFRNLLAVVHGQHGGQLFSTEPSDYQLTEIVLNPELYIPGDASTLQSTFAHLGLSFRNLKVITRQARDVKGALNAITLQNGKYTLSGWACVFATPTSIAVKITVAGADGGMVSLGQTIADLPSEPEIDYQCGTTGVPHRFQWDLPAVTLSAFPQHSLFVTGSAIQTPELFLRGSGSLLVPSASGLTQTPTTPMYRFQNAADRIYSSDPNWGSGFGYAPEGLMFRLSQLPNATTTALVECHRIAGGAHFLSTDPSCEGQLRDFTLGHLSKTNVPGLLPLYRFVYPAGGFSLATTNIDEGLNAHLNFEQILGFVWPT